MTASKTEHPGSHIREVLPAGMSVTDVAKKLGVGRPALSNLLNGKAALSPKMAARIEKTFGKNAEHLLRLQAEYDRVLAAAKEPALAVRAHVPPFMAIKASQIEAWSERLVVRGEFAAMLRRLVNSTGDQLTKVDFPAFENSQRKGWDGFVVAQSATPWIPLGNSGWEFGINKDPQAKANHDYEQRTKSIAQSTRKKTTFIFVTPRNWSGKDAWAAARKVEGQWKDVRSYDASDLEQWLETSIPAQAWLAEQFAIGAGDTLSLAAAWKRWAGVTDPALTKELFVSAVQTYSPKLAEWLKQPPQKPLTVVADSADEAMAALACLFDSAAVQEQASADRVIIVRSAEALSKIASAQASFVIVVASADAERESAGIQREKHTIVITRRNAVEGEPDIWLDLVDYQTLEAGLKTMGLDRDDIDRLSRESGHSLTVLRRRLSNIPAVHAPPWAAQKNIAERLIPLMLVGAWDSQSEADQSILAEIAAGTHEEVEKIVAELGAEDQSPVWSIGRFRGVLSKVDVFYAVQAFITGPQLKQFFQVARVVLSEKDPALELPEKDRWASSLYGKSRRHSSALRQGICETLVFLAVHGNNLFRSRVGTNVQGEVDALVRSLLTPFDPITWQSQQRDLPRYAEAAPDTFLSILEEDLSSKEPKVYALMAPAGSDMFSSPGRTGLLWALETLAWNSHTLPRVVLILGKLAELQVGDNWANRPDNSLRSIFRCWVPQTAASIDERIAALELLIRRQPDAGWRVCIDQFDPRSTVGSFTSRPRWRKDAIKAGYGAKGEERYKMARKTLDLAIGWSAHSEITLGDLLERLSAVPKKEQGAIWELIGVWAASGPSEEAKAILRETIRRTTMTRRRNAKGMDRKLQLNARATYDLLEPSDSVAKNQWLFLKHWVEESAAELEAEDWDHKKHEERIGKLREAALAEIWQALGFVGIARLANLSEAPGIIGWHLTKGVLNADELETVIGKILVDTRDPAQPTDRVLAGALAPLPPEVRARILAQAVDQHLAGKLGTSGILRLLKAAPFGAETWHEVDRLKEPIRQRYWREITPGLLFKEDGAQTNRMIDELLAVDRPRAAFSAVHYDFEKIESGRLVRLLFETATNPSEPSGHYQVDAHDISQAFDDLSKRTDLVPDELARLEFLYIDSLDHSKHGIPNLERQLAQSPELFVQFLAFAFKRNDDGIDPPELRPSNSENASNLASAAYRLLTRARRIPGTNDIGEINARSLFEWISRVQNLARECARDEVALSILGQLLGRSPPGSDGIWPHEAVREVIEDLWSSELSNAIRIGRSNSRGAVWRGKGGAQERTIAEQYRGWSSELGNKYPFTARVLADIAEMYEHDAEWHDTESKIRRRLQD